jgi:UDP-2,4-diacetamido-2,4,6-trideoxy-beta-L-altropyranose hydrolase
MNAPPRVLFVADAGRAVGGGHVMRCLTLAGALSAAGADCAFAASAEAAAILDGFAGPGIRRFAAPSGDPAALCALAAQAARTWGAQFAVLDHYGAGAAEDGLMRAAAGRLLAIEDLRRRRDADLVLDSNLGRRAGDYAGAEALVGPGFALVRPPFAALRAAALARRRADAAVEGVLVSLGLTDVGGITGRVVAALLPRLGQRRLDVVLGAGAQSLPLIEALAEQDPRVLLHVDARDMTELIAAADLAVGAGGSSAWERCVLGLPSVTLVLADNQRENTAALAKAGASLAIEVNGAMTGKIGEAFAALAADSQRRARMSRAAADLCDGLGAGRVAARMLEMIAGAGQAPPA